MTGVRKLPRSQKTSAIVAAAFDDNHINGLTHNFYRYPARFSPTLVRATIEAFTEPGDLVLDPFVGGGTTLVEALALGRNAIGSDISSLAAFVSEVKTTVLSSSDLDALDVWSHTLQDDINIHAPVTTNPFFEEQGYLRHLDSTTTWRLRKAIDLAVAGAQELGNPRLEAFARCVVLRTAQWALNGRVKFPTIDEFRTMLQRDAVMMIAGARELAAVVPETARPTIHCLNQSTSGLEKHDLFADGANRPRLVVTSPPYPGVHVLYHRWQVDGRKETPAPFWIANRLDGDGAAYYTMGSRSPHLNTYFDNLRASLRSVAAVCGPDTMIVQIVAFSNPKWQLSRYLSVADEVGLEECMLPNVDGSIDGRLWRTVPNRRWYADQRGVTHSSQEVVLFHRRKR